MIEPHIAELIKRSFDSEEAEKELNEALARGEGNITTKSGRVYKLEQVKIKRTTKFLSFISNFLETPSQLKLILQNWLPKYKK